MSGDDLRKQDDERRGHGGLHATPLLMRVVFTMFADDTRRKAISGEPRMIAGFLDSPPPGFFRFLPLFAASRDTVGTHPGPTE